MTDFAECSMAMQDFLMILLEICLILELILLLIRITCFYRIVSKESYILFLREKENYNSSDCFCSFFYAYGFPDE